MAAGHRNDDTKIATKKEKLMLIIPSKSIKEPIVHEIGHKFGLITNILYAEVKDGFGGIIVFEVDGENENIEKAKDFLISKKVKVL